MAASHYATRRPSRAGGDGEMNLGRQKRQRFARIHPKAFRCGFTLIEMLVYMGMLFLILGMAYIAMYRSMDASAGLRRNANDITRALETGELWREDVRGATR